MADYIDPMSQVFDAHTTQCVAAAIIRTLEARRKQLDVVRRSARKSAERWFSASFVFDPLLGIIELAVEQRQSHSVNC